MERGGAEGRSDHAFCVERPKAFSAIEGPQGQLCEGPAVRLWADGVLGAPVMGVRDAPDVSQVRVQGGPRGVPIFLRRKSPL
jgi:hypothetical protein